jgi:hypothetical protein
MQAWQTFFCPPPRQSCTASTSALLFLEWTRRVLGAVRPFLKELNRSGAVLCFLALVSSTRRRLLFSFFIVSGFRLTMMIAVCFLSNVPRPLSLVL